MLRFTLFVSWVVPLVRWCQDEFMRLRSVLGNSQRLDGGAMFGNAPKALWQRWIAPDERNRIPLNCRCLLIETDDSKILLETGIGAYLPPKLADRFGVVESEHVLLASLAKLGVSPEEIDYVVLSHLHFDHAGGLLSVFAEGQAPRLVFPQARFVVGKEAWERCQHPHYRDRASFIRELPSLLTGSERLHIIDGQTDLLDGLLTFHYSAGHTPGMMLTEVATERGPLVFAADLIPGVPWVHLPITMGYDRFPEKLIEEKQALLQDLRARDGWLFFTHDSTTAAGKVTMSDKGKYAVEDTVAILDW